MKSTLPPSDRHGFSLVELLVVIMIIAILMGLTVVGTQFALAKSYESKTRIQIKTLEGGIEKFYNDRMEYPNESNSGSKVLYIALTGDGITAGDMPPNKPKYTGTPNGKLDDTERGWSMYLEELLSPGSSKSLQGWVDKTNIATKPVIDAFGNEIQYVCKKSTSTSTSVSGVQNTAYDLWSYGTDSTLQNTPNAANAAKWIKNW